jgi:hypothetical protein
MEISIDFCNFSSWKSEETKKEKQQLKIKNAIFAISTLHIANCELFASVKLNAIKSN